MDELNQEYLELVRDKRIVVCGPGPLPFSLEWEADFLVSINAHDLQSYKPRITYTYGAEDPGAIFDKRWEDDSHRFVWIDRFPSGWSAIAVECTSRHIPSYTYSRPPCLESLDNDWVDEFQRVYNFHDDWVSDFQRAYNFHALTGVLALHHLTLYPVKSIHVVGMDLYYDWENYKLPKMRGTHDLHRHCLYLADLLIRDRRVSYDNRLLEVITRFLSEKEKERDEDIIDPELA